MNPDGMAHFCISSPPITFLYSHNYLFISTLFFLFFLIYYQIFDEMA